jgi:hypothetical protein
LLVADFFFFRFFGLRLLLYTGVWFTSVCAKLVDDPWGIPQLM